MSLAPWRSGRDESIGRRIGYAPLVPLGWLYGLGASWHRAVHRKLLAPEALPIPVVSVGSLVVGGTGKTPLAAWIAASLRARGHRVALASRGYGAARRRNAVVVVSDGLRLRTRAELAGDEPMLLASHAPGVPVLVGRDRARVGRQALAAFGSQILVLDDGFQHHRLRRDVDLLTVDGRFGFGNGHPLPRGPLRERSSALRFADGICVVDGALEPRDIALLERHSPSLGRFQAERVPRGVRSLAGGAAQPASSLEGLDVGVFAGVANPDAVRHSLRRLGARVVRERWFADHHRYQRGNFGRWLGEAPRWVTTEKDAVKITPDWVPDRDIRVLRIDLAITDPATLLDWLEARLVPQAGDEIRSR